MNVKAYKAALLLSVVSALVAFPREAATPVPATTTTVPHLPTALVAQWERVAWCETHGEWWRNEPLFDGGLGISRVVWQEVGGTDYAPAPHLASKEDQIRVAIRIQTRGGVPHYVPDQDGSCKRW